MSEHDQQIESQLHMFPFRNAQVSTMTVMIRLSLDQINLEKLLETKVDGYTYFIRVPGERKNKRKNFKPFRNSLSVIFDTLTRRVCVKVFRNGKLQITGCKTLCDTLELATKFCSLYYILSDTNVHVVSSDIHMYNIIFNLNKSINLDQLHNDLKKNNHTSIYNRDIYSGIKIKQSIAEGTKPLTVLGFSSGNFILAGLKKPEDIASLSPITSFLARI